MELLQKLADATLPLEVFDPVAIHKLRVLQDAGLVVARLPADRNGLEPGPALALEVTPLGRKTLRHFGPVSRSGP